MADKNISTGSEGANNKKSLKEKLLALQLTVALAAGGAAVAGCADEQAKPVNDLPQSTPIEQPANTDNSPMDNDMGTPEANSEVTEPNTSQPSAETNSGDPFHGQHYSKLTDFTMAAKDYYNGVFGDQWRFELSSGATERSYVVYLTNDNSLVARYKITDTNPSDENSRDIDVTRVE